MAQFWLYGDESGSVPKDDLDAPFVAAVLAANCEIRADEIASEYHKLGSADWLVREIVGKSLMPLVVYVKPHKGFGEALSRKYQKMEAMARDRKRTTGKHAYLPPKGFNTGNLIWSHAMKQAIGLAIFNGLLDGSVDAIHAVLHTRTLESKTEKMFIDQVLASAIQIKDTLEAHRSARAKAMELLLVRLNLPPKAIDCRLASVNDVPALWLPHHLARLARKALITGATQSIFQLLATEGFNSAALDLTPFLLAPINEDAIARYKKDTGLPEPKIEAGKAPGN